MNNSKKFAGKINADICMLYVSDNNNIAGYLAVSILYKSSKTGNAMNQIGNYELKNNIFKTETEALAWASDWILTNFHTKPNFVIEQL